MDRRENVIRGLQCTISPNLYCRNCEYFVVEDMGVSFCDRKSLMLDALELLKAQEQKKLRCIRHLTKVMKGVCPVCEMEIESVKHGRITKFCKFCGQAVKWE